MLGKTPVLNSLYLSTVRLAWAVEYVDFISALGKVCPNYGTKTPDGEAPLQKL